MTMLTNRKNDELLRMAYASYKERKSMTSSERAKVRKAYTEHTMNNTTDDGRKGKTFEVTLRELINPNTMTLKCQKQGLADLPIVINKKRVKIECKTGGGELSCNLWLENWREEFNPLCDMNFDYIAYVMEYNHTVGDLWERTVIMTKDAFIEWLSSYNGEVTGLLTYKKNEGRIMIGNPRASKKRRNFIENLPKYAKSHNDCYSLGEFLTMADRASA